MLSANDTITRLGGLARGSTLQQLGFTRQALAREAERGNIHRIRNGVFATTALNEDVRTAIEHGGSLTCASLLRTQGVWVLPRPDGVHVWMPAKRHPLPHADCGCVSHYFQGTPPLGETSVETALRHLRRCAGDEAFFAAYESAWRQGRLPRAARARIRSALPRTARWLVDIARSDADSGLESLLRLRFHLLGIRLDCQVSIDGVGRVDFVVAGRLIIEADGEENHGSVAKRHHDRVRDAAASRLGYETLRFDYAQIVHDWAAVQAAIVAALRRLRVIR
ncbi:endonuclease domain-containing protein [Microbacterium sp. NPDC056234]|uniref:endonuclease domain-containing protein n=1 Tax=Microbacterium sp. NPDC056234 TaxID=3345757 RepID=UPI0035E1674C